MKVKSMKGFTLAELLIVMAIIVVLAAVAIPTFGKQLETARESADLEDVRNFYTEAYTVALKDSMDGTLADASKTQNFDLAFRQTLDGWTMLPSDKVGNTTAPANAKGKNQVTFAFDYNATSGDLECTGITATTKGG